MANYGNLNTTIDRRLFMGSVGLSVIAVAGTSLVRDKTQKIELENLGITISAKHIGFIGFRSRGISNVELVLTKPGRYIVELFDGSTVRLGKAQSLLSHKFEVIQAPHCEILPDMNPHIPVLIHISFLTEQSRIKTGLVVVGETE